MQRWDAYGHLSDKLRNNMRPLAAVPEGDSQQDLSGADIVSVAQASKEPASAYKHRAVYRTRLEENQEYAVDYRTFTQNGNNFASVLATCSIFQR